MTAEDDAYQAAKKAIARAKRSKATDLFLTGEPSHALTNLPPKISTCSALTWLELDNTQVSDLAPLAAMKGMRGLYLSNTQVSDLAPLATMTGMQVLYLTDTQVSDLAPLAAMTGMERLDLKNTPVSDLAPLAAMKGMRGLYLSNTQVSDLRPLLAPLANVDTTRWDLRLDGTPAALDPDIAPIAALSDGHARAVALRDLLLRGWQPKGPSTPEPDGLLPVHLTDGRLEIARSLPAAAELDDRLKRALHDRLRLASADLARLAGNKHARLAGRARSLAERLDRPFGDLDMVNIHLDVEDLATSLRTNPQRDEDERFGPDVLDALTSVAENGPGLTLDNPDVEKLEERKRRFRDGPPPPEVMLAHQALSQAAAHNTSAIGDNLRALEGRLAKRPDEPSSGAIQVSVHRDMLIKIGKISQTGAGQIAWGVMGNAVYQLIASNWPEITTIASSYGAGFYAWFTQAVAPLLADAAGFLANIPPGQITTPLAKSPQTLPKG